jgi:hypothetical protein
MSGSSGEDELCFLDVSGELALVFSLHSELLNIALFQLRRRRTRLLTRTAVRMFLTHFAQAAISFDSIRDLFQLNCSPPELKM